MPALTQLSDGPAAPEFGVGPITPGDAHRLQQ